MMDFKTCWLKLSSRSLVTVVLVYHLLYHGSVRGAVRALTLGTESQLPAIAVDLYVANVYPGPLETGCKWPAAAGCVHRPSPTLRTRDHADVSLSVRTQGGIILLPWIRVPRVLVGL